MNSTRRFFLKSALGAPLAATLDGAGARLWSVVTPGQGEEFENPHLIRYDTQCFTINDRDTFIFSGAFHYPRCPRALWRDRLRKFRRAGFNTIEAYVFWNYHEPEEGHSNLSEFEDFIKLVQEMGFWMIARPGPYVCAEWERGGFPEWVIAKQFPLRSNHPESIRTSEHWYSQVLPVIQRHQITHGGPIIMMQVENEYDYRPPLPEADRKEYIRALARMAWNAGIDVPLITCWTKQARENSDPDMARIMDTCSFYPRWMIDFEVLPALQKLRREEPDTPLGITELQGGWFSEIGGKLSVDQDGVDALQLNALSKTVMGMGVTYFSYYMGFGGTNFDWAAKNLTTTYDYAAPIREPGGLWDKYYAARGIGSFLGMYGTVLTRAKAAEGATQSTNKNVSVAERINGKSGVLFVRESGNAKQSFQMTFRDPNSPTGRTISVPREGALEIGPREMKMLPLQVPIAGGQIRYTTAEVLAHGLNLDRHFLILYDDPGRLVELSLATVKEPQVEGDTVYQYYDSDFDSIVMGVRVESTEKILMLNNHLLVILLPRERALRSLIPEFSPAVVPGSEETNPMAVPLISDAALMNSTGATKKSIWAELEFAAQPHDVIALLPTRPTKCWVDNVETDFQYDRHWRTTRLSISTPAIPARSSALEAALVWVDRFDANSGRWSATPLRPLHEIGPLPYGYVKYRAQFAAGPPKMFITTYADDAKQVFVNGLRAVEASNNKKEVELPLAGYIRQGANTIEIAYELFGSPNFGENLGELKGVASVLVGTDSTSATAIQDWQVQLFPAHMKGRELDPGFSPGIKSNSPPPGRASGEVVPAFAWCRAEFSLAPQPEEWSIPWKLAIEGGHDALLYLNRKFIGRYATVGPQKEFYLPDPFLVFDSKRKNVLTIVLAYTEGIESIRALRVRPYEEFATRRTRLEFEW